MSRPCTKYQKWADHAPNTKNEQTRKYSVPEMSRPSTNTRMSRPSPNTKMSRTKPNMKNEQTKHTLPDWIDQVTDTKMSQTKLNNDTKTKQQSSTQEGLTDSQWWSQKPKLQTARKKTSACTRLRRGKQPWHTLSFLFSPRTHTITATTTPLPSLSLPLSFIAAAATTLSPSCNIPKNSASD